MAAERSDDHPGPHRPARAYQAVIDTMGTAVARWFLTTPPPPSGVLLTVIGKDAVPTQWQMTEGLAGGLAPRLSRNRNVLRIVATTYDDRARA